MKRKENEVVILDNNINLDKNNYKEIWDEINELIFVIEIDEKFIPKHFVDANKKFCEYLGYSKDQFIKIPPSDIIFSVDKKETISDIYINLISKRFEKAELILRTKHHKTIYVKANIFFFRNNGKNYISSIATDITKIKKLEKQVNGIFRGIPDVIKVFKPDHTIVFFNEAGYSFYNKTQEEVKNKKCYEALHNNKKCKDCLFQRVIQTKKMIVTEKYIPELNKFMDVCYNPVLDENGDILFVVERLRDITEKKFLDKLLKDSKEKYKQILNNSPDATLIIVDNKIVLANYEACNLFRKDYNEIIDSNIYKHFPYKYIKSLHKRFRSVILQKRVKDTKDYEFDFGNDRKSNFEVSLTCITYDGRPAVLAIIRDITEIKQQLTSAAKLQRNSLQSSFPCEEYLRVVSVYTPAHMISGDFYRIQKIDENSIIGILIDVRGKGISAALNISALDVLFLQEISSCHEPMDIVNSLNEKLVSYYEENYIAVCCFSMDFKKKELKVVGAGINRFIFQKKGHKVEEKIIKGPFLGMFENSDFSEEIITFDSGDKIFFLSDGLDYIFDEDKIMQRYMGKVSISDFKAYIDEFLEDTRVYNGKLDDDSTMIAMEIK